jgi:hypothetical protein
MSVATVVRRSPVVHRSGPKVGTVAEARVARDIYAANKVRRDEVSKAWDKKHREWAKGGYKGTCPPYPEVEDIVPEGWEKLGSGSYRAAYLSPSGVVYKVNHRLRDSKAQEGSNYAEMMNIIKLRKGRRIPDGWAVPDATLYRVPLTLRSNDYVIAMPKVDTSAPLGGCGWDCECKHAEGNRRMGGKCTDDIFDDANHVFKDLHYGNAFPQKDGVIVVIDVGL